ncbi:MAG: hypothetical protein E7311_03615 [Clostridiales bacterium]|nr:hypothetical protein [Clostridiales bacterium]
MMERICNLYISDEHLLVTLSGYLKKEIENGTKVIVLSQDNMKKSIRDIKRRINNKELKEKVDYLDNIKINLIAHDKRVTVIIKGDNNFISNMENKVREIFNEENELINIVSCYNINENKNIGEIINEYEKMLNTTGVIDLKQKNDLQNV